MFFFVLPKEGTSANVLDLAEEVGETFQACYTAQKSNCLDFIKKVGAKRLPNSLHC